MRIIRFLVNTLSTKTASWIFCLAALASQLWVIQTLDNTSHKVFKLQTICVTHRTPAETGVAARHMLEHDWTPSDISHFQRHFILDYWIHPVLYGLAITSLCLHEFKRQHPPASTPYFAVKGALIALFIFSASLCDIKENSLHSSIQFEPTLDAPDDVLWTASVFATTKWFVMVISIGALVHSYSSHGSEGRVKVV